MDLVVFHDITGSKYLQEFLEDSLDYATESLRKSEERLSGIFDSTPDSITIFDFNGTIIDCNTAAVNLFGFSSKQELIGKDAYQLVAPKDRDRTVAQLKRVHEIGLKGHSELTFLTKEGKEFPGESSGAILRDGKGQPKAFMSITRNVEYRLKMEKALMDSEEKYRKLFDEATDAIFLADAETGTILDCNQAASTLVGYEKSELLGKHESFLHPGSRIHEVDETIETKIITKEGEVKVVAIKANTLMIDGKKLFQAILRDITESKRIETAIAESEERHRMLFEEALDAIIIADVETGIIVDANPAALRMLGKERSELIGHHQSSIHHPDEVKNGFSESFKAHVKAEAGTLRETRLVKKNGKIRVATVKASIFELEGRRFIQGTFRDITESKKAAEALKTSEARARAVFENSPIGIATTGSDRHFTTANKSFCDILGYSEDELKTMTFKDITHPEDLEQSIAGVASLVSGEKSCVTQEKRYIRKDGSVINGKIYLSVIRNRDRKPAVVIAELEDITQRKLKDLQLLQEKYKLDAMTQSIGAGFVTINKDYRVIWANKFIKDYKGDVEGKLCYATLNDLDHICQNCGVKKVFENGALFDAHEYASIDIKGNPYWVELIATPIKDENGKVTAAVEVAVDITEKKRLEAEIMKERNLLEAITKNINAGLMLMSRDKNVLWINDFSKRMYGADIVNKKCYLAIHGRDKPCEDCGVERVFNGSSIDTRQVTVCKKGRPRILEVTATPMKDKDGNIISTLELAMDVTELRKAQSQLAEYSQALEEIVKKRTEQLRQTQSKLVKSERLAAIGELAGMVGHDLRNPLSGIKNAVYFLQKKGNTLSEAQAKMMFETIDKCIDRSNKIINDLLDYSRDIHLEVMQDCSPRLLLLETLSTLEVPEKVKLTNNVPDDVHIEADAGKIQRVFINIIKNAIDSMPEGGTITINSKVSNGKLELSFADTGSGIPADILLKLFSPLVTTKAQGMGFGLPICKRLIEAHHGKITVETMLGKGTAFKITLPLRQTGEVGGEKIWVNPPESLLLTTTKT